MTDHLGYEKHRGKGAGAVNSRSGRTSRTLRTDHGPMTISVPRDRDATFEPKLVCKHQRHFDGFDDKILAMYVGRCSPCPRVATA